MEVSIRDAMLPEAGFFGLVEGLKGLGLDRVELAIRRDMTSMAPESREAGARADLSSPEAVELLRKQLADHGIGVSAVLLANNFNAVDLPGELDWVVDCVRAARRLGAAAVRIDSALQDDSQWTPDQRRDRFATCLTEILDRTDAEEMPLGVENHGPHGNNLQFLTSVWEQVDSPLLGVTLDTANWYWFGYPLSDVYEIHQRVAPLVKHTHIKNIRYPASAREVRREVGWMYGQYACPIPDGDIDHRRTVGYLAQHGYQGDLCVEDESLGRFSQEVRRNVLQRDVAYVRQLAKEFS